MSVLTPRFDLRYSTHEKYVENLIRQTSNRIINEIERDQEEYKELIAAMRRAALYDNSAWALWSDHPDTMKQVSKLDKLDDGTHSGASWTMAIWGAVKLMYIHTQNDPDVYVRAKC